MLIKLSNYQLGYRIVSLAKCQETIDDLLEDKIDILAIQDNTVVLLPDHVVIDCDADNLGKLLQFEDYDVFQIDPSGRVHSYYSVASTDNAFFITGKCNSNCIMCPSPDSARKNVETTSLPVLLELIKHIPTDAKHFTITGGEPFLMGQDIFIFFEALRNKFTETAFLLLTNGRIFSVPSYCERLKATLPPQTLIGIPVHGYDADTHDYITRAPGSFMQTHAGLKNLLALGFHIEIRIVVSRISAPYLDHIADYILSELPGVFCVKFIGLEMLGNAAKNCDKVWISYPEAFQKAKPAIKRLITGGVDVGLYNFPLCAVDKDFWTICAKSISDYKVRFSEECAHCTVKDACGGIFAGTYRLAKEHISPLEGEKSC